MGYVGFVTGILMGIAARDNFQFSMGEKMDSIAEDYEEMNKKS